MSFPSAKIAPFGTPLRIRPPYARAVASMVSAGHWPKRAPAARRNASAVGVTVSPVAGTFTYSVATAGKGEACATCHGVGKAEDITVKHK